MTHSTNERIVRFVADVALDAGCGNHWVLRDASRHDGDGISALFSLADAASEAPTIHEDGWNFFCPMHRVYFGVNKYCPVAKIIYRAGETVAIPVRLAEVLERNGQIVYPTHVPEPDQQVEATLAKVNALMEREGLPPLDAESLRSIKVEGKCDHYGATNQSSPANHRLATDLGLDPEDIQKMREALDL